jgi:hypothetical protein
MNDRYEVTTLVATCDGSKCPLPVQGEFAYRQDLTLLGKALTKPRPTIRVAVVIPSDTAQRLQGHFEIRRGIAQRDSEGDIRLFVDECPVSLSGVLIMATCLIFL